MTEGKCEVCGEANKELIHVEALVMNWTRVPASRQLQCERLLCTTCNTNLLAAIRSAMTPKEKA